MKEVIQSAIDGFGPASVRGTVVPSVVTDAAADTVLSANQYSGPVSRACTTGFVAIRSRSACRWRAAGNGAIVAGLPELVKEVIREESPCRAGTACLRYIRGLRVRG